MTVLGGIERLLRVKLEREPEEREERLGVEEEAELDDLAVLDLEHLQRPRLIAVAALARLVLPERRRAVGGHGRDHAGAAAAGTRAVPPREDVVAAAEPEVERRHRLGRVLVDQGYERVHVVALEGLDVAGEQFGVELLGRR